MAIREFTVTPTGGQPVTIYAEQANLDYFLDFALTPDAMQGTDNRQASIPSYTRRQFPGDLTPMSVPSTTKEYLYDPEMRVGSALPGKSFVLAAYAEPAPGQKRFSGAPLEKRQFTYKGRFIDLHAFLQGECTYDTMVHNSSGAKHPIVKSGA